MQIESIWIIGGGKFGLKAAAKLHHQNPDSDITVVEKEAGIGSRLNGQAFKLVCMDGIDYLFENLKEPDGPDWIVPAIPKHVAYEWIKKVLSGCCRFEELTVPQALAERLPNPVRGPNGELYVSNADFVCPEDCPEPSEICTHTGKPRPRVLHRFLKTMAYNNYYPVVVKSRQLCRGVGGYSPKALFTALDEVVAANAPVLLSTACRCHGVVHAFSIQAPPDVG